MLDRLKALLLSPKQPRRWTEEDIQRSILEARELATKSIAAKDQFTSIPLPDDLPSKVAINAKLTLLERGGATVPPSLIDHIGEWPIVEVIWAVPTARASIVYMAVDRTPYRNDERYVTIVEARAFYALWMSTRGKQWGFPNLPANEGEFPRIRKWKDQAQCWSHGLPNPVPLAEIGCSVEHGTGLGFIDGITRTSWLLHNGAAAFPVLSHAERSALELDHYAGAGIAPVTTVEELLSPPGMGCLLQ